MISITIDTSVVAAENDTFEFLIDAHMKGLLDVGVASRFRMDKENDPDAERVKRQKAVVDKLSIIPSTFLIGAMYHDQDIGLLADDELHQQLFCLFDIDHNTRGGRHSAYDVDHMYSHIVRGRDFFLTYEKKYVRKRVALQQVGLNISDPDIYVLAVKQAILSFEPYKPEFKSKIEALIEQMHSVKPNLELQRRLSAMRQAQRDIIGRVFSKEDEKAIRYLAQKYKSYRGQSKETAIRLYKQKYHDLKNMYLSRYPNKPIKATNIVEGILEMYRKYYD